MSLIELYTLDSSLFFPPCSLVSVCESVGVWECGSVGVWECGREERGRDSSERGRDSSRMPILIQYVDAYENEYAYLCIGLCVFVVRIGLFLSTRTCAQVLFCFACVTMLV